MSKQSLANTISHYKMLYFKTVTDPCAHAINVDAWYVGLSYIKFHLMNVNISSWKSAVKRTHFREKKSGSLTAATVDISKSQHVRTIISMWKCQFIVERCDKVHIVCCQKNNTLILLMLVLYLDISQYHHCLWINFHSSWMDGCTWTNNLILYAYRKQTQINKKWILN